MLYKLQRYEEAYTYIEKAITADPEPSDVLYEHAGAICYRLGMAEQAQTYWDKALELKHKKGDKGQ